MIERDSMTINDAFQKFYYAMTLNELRLMHTESVFPNISYNSLLYMDLIFYGEKCTVTYLAETLHITKSAVTIKVNELIKQGMVIKEQSSEDKRMFYLSLSQQAEMEWRNYDRMLKRAIESMEQKYKIEDMEILLKMMNTLCEEFKKVVYNE